MNNRAERWDTFLHKLLGEKFVGFAATQTLLNHLLALILHSLQFVSEARNKAVSFSVFRIAVVFCADYSDRITCTRHCTPSLCVEQWSLQLLTETKRVRIAIAEIVSYLYRTLSKNRSPKRLVSETTCLQSIPKT